MNVCLASKELCGLAIPILYRNSLVKDRRELFYFFSALAQRPDRRLMVRSFSWVGGLWEDDVDPESKIALSHKEATAAADCWSSIKDKWPREGVDYEIAKISKSGALRLYQYYILLLAGLAPSAFIRGVSSLQLMLSVICPIFFPISPCVIKASSGFLLQRSDSQ